MEPIFNSGTLTSEGNAFQRIDKDFRYIMKHIAADSRLLSIVKINNIVTVIESLETQLARCQSALQSFITVSIIVEIKIRPKLTPHVHRCS